MLYFPHLSEDIDRIFKKDLISQPSVLPLIHFFLPSCCLVFPGRVFLRMANDPGLSALFHSRILHSDWKLCVTVWDYPTLKFIEGSGQVIHVVQIFPFSLLRLHGVDSSDLLGRYHTGRQCSGARRLQLHVMFT